MRYRIKDLKVFVTSKAKEACELSGLPEVEFEFPGILSTILLIDCWHDRQDPSHFEVVGRLYESNNPQQTGEKHIGKLYIHVREYPYATRFETKVERFEWYPNGSFDVILPNGERLRRTPPRR